MLELSKIIKLFFHDPGKLSGGKFLVDVTFYLS